MTKTVIGVAAASVVLCAAMGAFEVGRAHAAPSEPVRDQPSGRFVIYYSPRLERDTFLLDTATGRSWVSVDMAEGGPTAWLLVRQVGQ